ncbi:hypothetical protein K4H28_00890 [Deefgea tanakiae]|jgi:hypothetical protein|uniref:Uncharacterized protein n=1 Tax=Deefgea tanakiae TaxID=2865840 RepID=A0ABX8Z6U1_9NEIS|nr:hypothetical protein [Deefgea tanakiae]QZA78032.1 hypothetical protein K4H28_00890 [Deefgea tanakiae]
MRKIAISLVFILTAAPSFAATFCPWKVPSEAKAERFINLTVVQFVDVGDDDVKIAFGGGNLGSGYDVRIPSKTREDANKILKSMQETAKQCDK